MGGVCGKTRPKYIQHVRALYPNTKKGQSAGQAQNVTAFVHYAIANPRKVGQIGDYMLRRVEKHLRRGEKDKVRVMMTGINSLMESCQSDAARAFLYEAPVRRALLLLLEHPDMDCKIMATETFEKYARQQDSDDVDAGKLESFFKPLVTMCRFTSSNAESTQRVRMAAMESLECNVRYNDVRGSAEHFADVIPTILMNISESDIDEKADFSNRNLSSVSLSCLKQVAQIVDLTTVADAMRALLAYFNSKSWEPEHLCSFCLVYFANHCRELPNSYNITYEVLRDLTSLKEKQSDVSKRFEIEARILRCLAHLVLEMRLSLGAWQGLSTLLLQLFQASLSANATEQVRIAYTKVLESYCQRMPNAYDSVQLLENICEQVLQSESEEPVTVAFLESAVLVASMRREITDSSVLPTVFLKKIFALCEMNRFKNRNLSFIALKTLVNVLIPFDPSELKSSESQSALASRKVTDFLKRVSSNGGSLKFKSFLSPKDLPLIRAFLSQDLLRYNVPPHEMHFALAIVLLVISPWEELCETTPIFIDALRSLPTAESGFSYPLYLFILSYVRSLASIMSSFQAESTKVSAQIEDFVVKYSQAVDPDALKMFDVSPEIGYKLLYPPGPGSLADAPSELAPYEVLVSLLAQYTIPESVSTNRSFDLVFRDFTKPDLGKFESSIYRMGIGTELDPVFGDDQEISLSSAVPPQSPSSEARDSVDLEAPRSPRVLAPLSADMDFTMLTEVVGLRQVKQDRILNSVLADSYGVSPLDPLEWTDGDKEKFSVDSVVSIDRKTVEAEDLKADASLSRPLRKGSTSLILNLPDQPPPLASSEAVLQETAEEEKKDLTEEPEDFNSTSPKIAERLGNSTLKRKFPALVGVSDSYADINSIFTKPS